MKVLLLVLLCILTVALYGSNSVDDRETQCLDIKNNNLSYAYFSPRYIAYYGGNYRKKFLSICLCQKSFNQTFFVFPYMYDQNTFEDAFVFCLYNTDNYQSAGIYDAYELLDTMLFNRMVSVPNSVVDPMGNDEHRENESNKAVCYDWFGLPTKNVLGQRTCLLAVDISLERKYIYSGPLMGNAMITFSGLKEIDDGSGKITVNKFSEKQCFTTTNASLSVEQEDFCFYEVSETNAKFQCCCAHSPEKCSPKYIPKKLFCMPGKFGNHTELGNEGGHGFVSMENYTRDHINYACSITIVAESNSTNSFSFAVKYKADATCKDEIKVLEAERFCSSNLSYPSKLNMTKCCKDGHFCNLRLMPKQVEHRNCSYKTPHIAFITDQSKCDFYVDIKHDRQVQILLGYNAKLPKQMRHGKVINGTEQYYIYLQIIKADPKDCKKKLLTNAKEYRPFIHGYCETENCDKEPSYRLPQNFPNKSECQTLKENTKFDITNFTTGYLPSYSQPHGWICYVEIKSDDKGSTVIQAGELKNIVNHVECLKKDIMKKNGRFCCSHIFFDIQQNTTKCTVEKLIEKYKENQVNTINGKSRNGNKYYTTCFIRGLPHDSCLSEAGCFETRLLNYSKNSDAIEPAGCISNAEKYVSQNLPLSSLSLGCRSEENSNKCSVIQTPDGQQRILCCCNGEECKNNLRDLPNQIGKKVASFRGPK